MTLWVVLTLMICAAAIAVAAPFLRRQYRPVSVDDRAIELGRRQLEEINLEVAQGLLGPQEALSARTEIERRIVKAAKSAPIYADAISAQGRLMASVAVAGLVVLGSAGLYAKIGRPDLPSASLLIPSAAVATGAAAAQTAERAPVAGVGQSVGDVEDAISNLVARMRETPEDAEGWKMLGWSYFNTERYAESSAAYARAVTLIDDDPELWSLYGETLVRAANGLVTPAAREAFEKATELNPDDARARFFIGMALEQNGDPKAAVDAWIALLDSARPDADWRPGVLQRVKEVAIENGLDIDERLPQARSSLLPPSSDRGPSEEDVRAAAQMAPADRQAMIAGMVDQLQARLEEDPTDVDGWVKLMRSRVVLGEEEVARSAYLRATELFSESPEARGRLDATAEELGLSRK